MQKQIKVSKKLMVIGLILSLLPGCFGEKKNDSSNLNKGLKSVSDGTPTMFSIDGIPLITEKSFQEYFTTLVANNTNPQLQMWLQMFPNAKEEIFKTRANEDLLIYWAEQEGITQTKEYNDKLEQSIRMVKVGLAAESFQKTFSMNIEPTEAELRQYYDEHKEVELVTDRGGIKALGVEFASKEQAQDLYMQAKQSPKQFKAMAGARVKNLEITPQSPLDPAIKKAAMSVTTFPTILSVATADGKTWVVAVNGKQDPKYIPYEDVKQGLYQAVKQEKMGKVYIEHLDELKSKYNVVEDTSSLVAGAAVQEKELSDLEQQIANMSDEELQETLDSVTEDNTQAV